MKGNPDQGWSSGMHPQLLQQYPSLEGYICFSHTIFNIYTKKTFNTVNEI